MKSEVIVKIPSGEMETITQLISIPSEGYFEGLDPISFATYAIRDYDSVAWQPGDGRLLAFIGAINGPTADLYLYDTQTQEITQLTDGPSQAILPNWSPDGQYILHYGVSWVRCLGCTSIRWKGHIFTQAGRQPPRFYRLAG